LATLGTGAAATPKAKEVARTTATGESIPEQVTYA